MDIHTISSPLGNLNLIIQNNALTNIHFTSNKKSEKSSNLVFLHITSELENYFADPLYKMNVIMELIGTPFQLKIWQALQEIPAGEPLTYGELAKRCKTGPRAIGQACRTNPIPIIIPCHRIIAKSHQGGYSGQKYGRMTHIKNWLLNHEA